MDWQNSNTYAPWVTPDSSSGYNPSFSGYGAEHSIGTDWTGAGNDFNWMTGGGSWLGLGKKRSTPNFTAPSYQGHPFTPSEGLPSWYTDSDPNTHMYSMQGAASNSAMSPSAPAQNSNASQPMMPSGYGYAPMPLAVNSSAPDYAAISGLSPMSMGGYNSYGGYGTSTPSNSSYQPYVPTGYGQY